MLHNATGRTRLQPKTAVRGTGTTPGAIPFATPPPEQRPGNQRWRCVRTHVCGQSDDWSLHPNLRNTHPETQLEARVGAARLGIRGQLPSFLCIHGRLQQRRRVGSNTCSVPQRSSQLTVIIREITRRVHQKPFLPVGLPEQVSKQLAVRSFPLSGFRHAVDVVWPVLFRVANVPVRREPQAGGCVGQGRLHLLLTLPLDMTSTRRC